MTATLDGITWTIEACEACRGSGLRVRGVVSSVGVPRRLATDCPACAGRGYRRELAKEVR